VEPVLGLAGVVVGIVGVILTVYFARKSSRLDKARKRLEWADLQAAANDLGQLIKRDCTPIAIVTPGTRGATFANLLASEFTDQPPVYVGISTWKGGPHTNVLVDGWFEIETKKWIVHIPKEPSRYADGVVLIVDDFVMSGDFLDHLKSTLEAGGLEATRIRSASVAVTKVALKNHKAPDYYWWIADDDDFFFPWGKAR
jgi:hypoxanthine phosphoribosyltransferase